MTYTPTFELRLQILKSQRSTKGRREGGVPSSRFPCCVLSYFSLVFVMEHNWQIQVIRVSWVGQSTRLYLARSKHQSRHNHLKWITALYFSIQRSKCARNHNTCDSHIIWIRIIKMSPRLFFNNGRPEVWTVSVCWPALSISIWHHWWLWW